MSDEGFHEIQLNGKQLVFLFMAGTVVFVVVFLCGVLVGRGVQAELVAGMGEPSVAPAAAVVAEAEESPMPGEPAATAPPTPAEGELSYYRRLESDQPLKEELKPESAAPAEERAPARPEASREEAPAAETRAASAVSGEPTGPGFAVQIAALSEQNEAERVVTRLAGKGYSAYLVMPSAAGPAGVYRVRVGKFKTRSEAEGVAARLEKEEQFKPWIIR